MSQYGDLIFCEIAYKYWSIWCISSKLSDLRLWSCELHIPSSNRPETFVKSHLCHIFTKKLYVNWFLDIHFYYMLLYFSSLVKLFRWNLRNFIQVCWATLNYKFYVSYYKTFTMEIDVFTANLLLLIQSFILLTYQFISCMHVHVCQL